jgi:hypothetical protein
MLGISEHVGFEHWAEMLKGAQALLARARTMFDN